MLNSARTNSQVHVHPWDNGTRTSVSNNTKFTKRSSSPAHQNANSGKWNSGFKPHQNANSGKWNSGFKPRSYASCKPTKSVTCSLKIQHNRTPSQGKVRLTIRDYVLKKRFEKIVSDKHTGESIDDIPPTLFWDHKRGLPVPNDLESKTEIDPKICFNQFDGSAPYKSVPENQRNDSSLLGHMLSVCHIGQRKLLLTEIQHLNSMLSHSNEKAIVFYVGSAPSNKLFILHLLYPNVKFVLVDPNETLIYINGKNDDHYQHVSEDIVSYLSCSDLILNNPKKKRARKIKHYTAGVIDKAEISKKLEWEEETMINHIIDSNSVVYVFEEFMTKELAGSFNKLIKDERIKGTKILFWSDARTCCKKPDGVVHHDNDREIKGCGKQNCCCEVCIKYGGDYFPIDADIIANNAMMYVWLRTMTHGFQGSFNTMLKFRTPYFDMKDEDWIGLPDFIFNALKEARDMGVDFRSAPKSDYSKNSIKFFDGSVHIQAFAASTSTESRLWVSLKDIQEDNLVDYNAKEYEGKFIYYNCVERFCKKFKNPLANRELGFDHCGDCAIEASIWEDYIVNYNNRNCNEIIIAPKYSKNTWKFINGIRENFTLEKALDLVGRNTKPLTRFPHGRNF